MADRDRVAGQLPQPGAVFLDHVAHFVPAIEGAAAALERYGFRLTPYTAQTNQIDGATVPSGTGNRCAMLRRGYVEILAATPSPAGDTPLSRQLRERLAHHVGLHLAAFSTADAAAEHRRLANSGFDTLPLVDMRRPVALDGIEEDARFTIVRVAHGSMPEGRAQFLTHHTERLVWRSDYLAHPNGAEALTGLWLAAPNPAEPAERFARFTGRAARRDGEVATVMLERGAIHIATPEFLGNALGIVPGGTVPCLVATAIAVASLARVQALLEASGTDCRRVRLPGDGDGLAITLPAAIGDTMLFHEP